MDELGYKNTIVDKYLKARKIHNIDVYRLMGNHNVLDFLDSVRGLSFLSFCLLPRVWFPLSFVCLQHAKVRTRTTLPH